MAKVKKRSIQELRRSSALSIKARKGRKEDKGSGRPKFAARSCPHATSGYGARVPPRCVFLKDSAS